MEKIIKHYEKYFEQKCDFIYHDKANDDIHIDIVLFYPNEKYPFYKLATVGASSYSMKKEKSTLPNRNEFILFLSKSFNIKSDEFHWYLNFLSYMAGYAYYNNDYISVGHSIELPIKYRDKFEAGFVLFPQVIEDPSILRCKLGVFKKCACLEVIPITKEELEKKYNEGPISLHDYFYPENGEMIYLADRF